MTKIILKNVIEWAHADPSSKTIYLWNMWQEIPPEVFPQLSHENSGGWLQKKAPQTTAIVQDIDANPVNKLVTCLNVQIYFHLGDIPKWQSSSLDSIFAIGDFNTAFGDQ